MLFFDTFPLLTRLPSFRKLMVSFHVARGKRNQEVEDALINSEYFFKFHELASVCEDDVFHCGPRNYCTGARLYSITQQQHIASICLLVPAILQLLVIIVELLTEEDKSTLHTLTARPFGHHLARSLLYTQGPL